MLRKSLSSKFPESLDSGPLKMGPIGRPEPSAQNYHYSLRNNSEKRTSLILRGGSLESCMCFICPRFHVFSFFLTFFFPSLLPSFQYSFGPTKRYIAQTNFTKRGFRKTHFSYTLTKTVKISSFYFSGTLQFVYCCVGYEVLLALTIQLSDFCNVTTCNLA